MPGKEYPPRRYWNGRWGSRVSLAHEGKDEMGRRFGIVIGVVAAGVVALGAGACGGDDDDETTASAEKVTVTTSDTAKGYTWDVSPTPTAETKSVTLQNDSEEDHGLIFARLGKGYTVDEAFKLEGEKGSATEVIRTTGAKPGKSATTDVTEPLDPGDYVLLCPIAGKDGPHYKLGQLDEFAIE
jgi:hypothetical protein